MLRLLVLCLFTGCVFGEDNASTTVEPLKIIQPSQSQTVLNITAQTDVKKALDFRPSPQLNENFYEYNKFPVVPAQPEPKYFSQSEPKPTYDEKPDVWSTSMVRFPNTRPQTVNDHPYPFMRETAKGDYYNKLGAATKQHPSKYPYGDSWDKTLYKQPTKTYEDSYITDLTSSPWKKIIKMLATVIPIGLLISALTPSVITISPANQTTTAIRARSAEDTSDQPEHPAASILKQIKGDGCDERIFCELLLSAEESESSDRAVETLLDNYLEQKGNSEKLNRIYKAIENGNCSSLHCESMRDN